jgi:cell division protein FtsI/penicillin-binding protein 2
LLLGCFLLARGKASVASTTTQNHFYALELRTGETIFPLDGFLASGAPGSLIKLALAAAFCEANLPAAHQTVVCNGSVSIDGTTYTCRAPHGRMQLPLALGYSCNVFFASTVTQLGLVLLGEYLQRFGLERADHNAFNQRELPRAKFIDLSLGLTKEIIVDANQILNMMAMIATAGKRSACYPHQDGRRGSGRDARAPSADASAMGDTMRTAHGVIELCNDPGFRENTWLVLQQGMQLAGRKGTARNLDIHNKLHLAVKTGTTQISGKFQSWVAGYFPYEAPKYAFCLRAENGTSYDAAVPLARRFLFSRAWL